MKTCPWGPLKTAGTQEDANPEWLTQFWEMLQPSVTAASCETCQGWKRLHPKPQGY